MRRAAVLVPAAILVAASCASPEPAPTTTGESAPTATTATTTMQGGVMELSSPDFESEGAIPSRFTCDGADESPELNIGGIPEGTVSFALIMDDPDASSGTFDHWVVFDVEPTDVIPANVGNLGISGANSWKRLGYGGPCPPSGTHRYFFRILALDTLLSLEEGATKEDMLAAASGHVLGEGTLMGTYGR